MSDEQKKQRSKKNKKTTEEAEVQDISHVEQLQAQVKEAEEKYLRAIADYHNFEQRTMKERAAIMDRCKRDVLLTFLPVLDNLAKAELFIDDPGLKMIRDQFMQTLQMHGVEEVPLLGETFDPHLAECIELVDGEPEKIVEVLRNAYRLNGNVIQHGQVRVGRSSETSSAEDEQS